MQQLVKGSCRSVVGFTIVNSRTPGSRSHRSGRERSRESPSRGERKEATRRAIIAAALKLLQDRSFSALSLREVTREVGIVPAAFYRHFESMEALGLVLIGRADQTFSDHLSAALDDFPEQSSLRGMSADVRVRDAIRIRLAAYDEAEAFDG